jgi:hypothetical protein
MRNNRVVLPARTIFLLTFTVLLFSAGFLPAGTHTCREDELFEIRTTDPEGVDDICTAAGKAVDFLGRYGLSPIRNIIIEVVEQSIDSHGYIAFGSYDRQNDLIRIMSFPAVMHTVKSPEMYGQNFDREHYLGAVAHEVAHAVFHHNARNIEDQLTNVSQEYLAHATQLGVLTDERRGKILNDNDFTAWEPGDSISVTYMGLQPTGFAIKSYLHLTGLPDPKPFITLLLNHNWFYISVP